MLSIDEIAYAFIQTLAVGVNLPAHTVIIKGTMTWNGPVAGFKEYSDIDIQVSRRYKMLRKLTLSSK